MSLETNRTGVCDEGRVSFISSYRSNVSYRVGQRRFDVGHEYVDGVHHYFARDEADAAAVTAYLDNERAEFRKWAERRGDIDPEAEPHIVAVNRACWHVLIYGTPLEEDDG